MQSQNYSLTVTASTATSPDYGSLLDVLTDTPWLSDFGATYSSTNNLNDLHRLVKLPTPIPITGADGTIIYATHVGSAHFDTNHAVYFVPRSAVKLVSLGALTATGYSVHIAQDRSFVITRPTGITLCSHQSNNTWTFSKSFPQLPFPPEFLLHLPFPPGNNIFYSSPSSTPLIRSNFEVVSILAFNWKPKPVLQQTYITNINPTYEDIILRNDYPQPDQAIDQLVPTLFDPTQESAEIDLVTSILLPPTTDFPVPTTAAPTGPDQSDSKNQSNPPALLAQPSANHGPTPPTHRYPIHEHRAPAHLACLLNKLPVTSKSSLFVTDCEYKHAI
jgi:hypothetical protein